METTEVFTLISAVGLDVLPQLTSTPEKSRMEVVDLNLRGLSRLSSHLEIF